MTGKNTPQTIVSRFEFDSGLPNVTKEQLDDLLRFGNFHLEQMRNSQNLGYKSFSMFFALPVTATLAVYHAQSQIMKSAYESVRGLEHRMLDIKYNAIEYQQNHIARIGKALFGLLNSVLDSQMQQPIQFDLREFEPSVFQAFGIANFANFLQDIKVGFQYTQEQINHFHDLLEGWNNTLIFQCLCLFVILFMLECFVYLFRRSRYINGIRKAKDEIRLIYNEAVNELLRIEDNRKIQENARIQQQQEELSQRPVIMPQEEARQKAQEAISRARRR